MRVLMVPGGRRMGKHGKTQKRQLESLVIGPENWRNSEKDRLCEALKWPLVFFL
jgi:hypothetical protein